MKIVIFAAITQNRNMCVEEVAYIFPMFNIFHAVFSPSMLTS